MSAQSSLEFRSNLFVVKTNGQLINDRRFVGSISDPFALAELWRYNGTRGGLLNKLQKRQHEQAEHCMYAEAGDYPWGTTILDGVPRVVCLCENWGCRYFSECRPGVAPEDHGVDEPEGRQFSEREDAPAFEEEQADEEQPVAVEVPPAHTPLPDAGVLQPPPSVDGTDDSHDERWAQRTFIDDSPRGFAKHYDERQAIVVEASPTDRIYVTAGPGTGKTHTLIEKLKYMIDVQGVEPDSIIVMSFTRAAVQVVKDRLQSAAYAGELESNWQMIDVTTFDKFCTRLLYWLKLNEPKLFRRSDIGGMDYDHRIYAAAKKIRENPELVGLCQHLIVDETQDLVGPRAKLVLSLISALPKGCGITLLGDRCQSVYDYQVSKPYNSEAFYDSIKALGGFTEVTLERNYRQDTNLPYSLDALRRDILDRDSSGAGREVAAIVEQLGVPENELRSTDFSALENMGVRTLGILTRTNAQAITISSLLYKHDVPHLLLRAEREAYWSRILADVLMDYGHATIDEEHFISRAESAGLSFEDSMRAWISLTSLRKAEAEGARYAVERLLLAATEEIVPESLAAKKAVEPGITISTIHGSKGREFDEVWLIGDDLDKAAKSKDLDEQKVAYVALSRARSGTALQKSTDMGLKIDHKEDRCYRIGVPSRGGRRRIKKKLSHIELRSSKDLAFETMLAEPVLQGLAASGDLEGAEIRLCLPEDVPESGPVAYEIETEDGMLLGKTTLSFISYYELCYRHVVGGDLNYLPEAFDELFVDRIISCIGKSSTAPRAAKRFGDYAIWYGFVLGGFAHADNSQSH